MSTVANRLAVNHYLHSNPYNFMKYQNSLHLQGRKDQGIYHQLIAKLDTMIRQHQLRERQFFLDVGVTGPNPCEEFNRKYLWQTGDESDMTDMQKAVTRLQSFMNGPTIRRILTVGLTDDEKLESIKQELNLISTATQQDVADELQKIIADFINDDFDDRVTASELDLRAITQALWSTGRRPRRIVLTYKNAKLSSGTYARQLLDAIVEARAQRAVQQQGLKDRLISALKKEIDSSNWADINQSIRKALKDKLETYDFSVYSMLEAREGRINKINATGFVGEFPFALTSQAVLFSDHGREVTWQQVGQELTDVQKRQGKSSVQSPMDVVITGLSGTKYNIQVKHSFLQNKSVIHTNSNQSVALMRERTQDSLTAEYWDALEYELINYVYLANGGISNYHFVAFDSGDKDAVREKLRALLQGLIGYLTAENYAEHGIVSEQAAERQLGVPRGNDFFIYRNHLVPLSYFFINTKLQLERIVATNNRSLINDGSGVVGNNAILVPAGLRISVDEKQRLYGRKRQALATVKENGFDSRSAYPSELVEIGRDAGEDIFDTLKLPGLNYFMELESLLDTINKFLGGNNG